MRGGLGARASSLTIPFCLYHTDHSQNNWTIIILVPVLLVIVGLVMAASYVYNRQRKIRIYKLQKAQEEAIKLKGQAPPP
jgi:intercellular adhesion molecule 1